MRKTAKKKKKEPSSLSVDAFNVMLQFRMFNADPD